MLAYFPGIGTTEVHILYHVVSITTAHIAMIDQININYSSQNHQSEAYLIIPAKYDDLQAQLQATLMRIEALEGNLAAKCQDQQLVEENATQ